MLIYTLATDKTVYGANDPVDLRFTVANGGREDTTFEFATSQYYDFVIKRGNAEIARWSSGQTFTPAPPPVVLGSGKSVSFNTRWVLVDQDRRPIAPGTYQITAVFMLKENPIEVTLAFQKLAPGLAEDKIDGKFSASLTVTKDGGKNYTELSFSLACHQNGTKVTCVTPGGGATWTGTYAFGHLTLEWADSSESIRLIGDASSPGFFKGAFTGRYRQLLFWYNFEGIWSGFVL